ncbi:WhiB family transcriptional regulator [Terrabacter sp. GCM10028922]|uniref:WhiB family transcriptional regulator n=1 Tax=Terrabacter sp. GCM10028922 TaxID=3273428 RepID=UPI003612CF5C
MSSQAAHPGEPWGRPRPWVDRTGGPSLPELDMDRWHDDGLCRTGPANWWLSDEPADTVPGIEVCRDCPVRRLCLASALVFGDQWTIYGGTTPPQRRALTRRLRRGETLGAVLADTLNDTNADTHGATQRSSHARTDVGEVA